MTPRAALRLRRVNISQEMMMTLEEFKAQVRERRSALMQTALRADERVGDSRFAAAAHASAHDVPRLLAIIDAMEGEFKSGGYK